jgi:excisionase family DNA binding protein
MKKRGKSKTGAKSNTKRQRTKAKSAKRRARTTKAPPKTKPETEEAAGELMDMASAIELLKTTRPTFYRWLRSGKIKGMKVGRQWRFYREDIERFLKGEEPRIELPTDITPLTRALRERLKDLGVGDLPEKDEGEVKTTVNYMIMLARKMDATDIHIAPQLKEAGGEATAVLRYRVDGVLQPGAEFDVRLLSAIVARWKTMAACDVHEQVKPQDGRIMIRCGEDEFDLRVCFLPATLGESVTVRLRDRSTAILTLDRIDYAPRDKELLLKALGAPWGLILIEGGAGSGKTTVLYACLNHLAGPQCKIVTVEDPVEMLLPWAVQVQVRPDQGVTFARALRSVVRSAPNVIMIGQVRDLETLTLAQQAALTGHMVLTTLRVGGAAAALKHMVDIGVDPFVLAEATRLILAQRLVRKLCPHCSVEETPRANQLALAAEAARKGGLDLESLKPKFRKPVGCDKCRNTGYTGRTVIAETLEVTPEIEKALRNNASLEELKAIAVEQGMTTMAADGVRRAANGETALDEITRVISFK